MTTFEEAVAEYRAAVDRADQDFEAALAEAGAIFDAAETEIADKRGKPPDEDNAEYWEMIWPDFLSLWAARDVAHLVFQAVLGAAVGKLKGEMEKKGGG